MLLISYVIVRCIEHQHVAVEILLNMNLIPLVMHEDLQMQAA